MTFTLPSHEQVVTYGSLDDKTRFIKKTIWCNVVLVCSS